MSVKNWLIKQNPKVYYVTYVCNVVVALCEVIKIFRSVIAGMFVQAESDAQEKDKQLAELLVRMSQYEQVIQLLSVI